MKTPVAARTRQAFTLVEMVGVLAIIAIMASMLTPKIFSAVNEARLNNTVGSLDSIKTATVNYFGKYGNFTNTTDFDMTLVALEFLDRPFACRIGTGGDVQVVSGPGAGGLGYKFDGVTTNTAAASAVVECVLSNVAVADAWELSRRIDGDTLSASNGSSADTRGRVVYTNSAGLGLVYVYVAHR
jgi:prepilin-type N-terminal cleavage/methylation domain-containing protein